MGKSEGAARESKWSTFWKGVRTEFGKIIWPDRDTLIKQLIAILCVTVITGVLIALIDRGAQFLIDWLTTFKAA